MQPHVQSVVEKSYVSCLKFHALSSSKIILKFVYRTLPTKAKDAICNPVVMSVLSVCLESECVGKEAIGLAG